MKPWLCVVLCVVACGEQRAPTPGSAVDAGADTDGGTTTRSPLGGPCERDSDCLAVPGEESCFTQAEAARAGLSAPSGYCTTVRCNVAKPAATCGLSAVCGYLGLDGPLVCEAACGQESDCRAGFRCLAGGCVPRAAWDAGTEDAGSPESDAGFAMDGGSIDAGSIDAGFPRSWITPVSIFELNTSGSEDFPSMTEDMLRLCFTSDRAGSAGRDIWCAERASVDELFGTPVNQGAINSLSADQTPFLHGNEMIFGSDRSGRQTLWRAEWSEAAHAYVSPTPLSGVGGDDWDVAPALSGDGLRLFWESRRSGSQSKDIYLAVRPSGTASVTALSPLNSLNSSADEAYPSPAPDLSFLLFARWVNNTPTQYLAPLTNNVFSGPTRLNVSFIPNSVVLTSLRVLADGSLIGTMNHPGGTDLAVLRPRTLEAPGAPCGPTNGVWTYSARGPCLLHQSGRPDQDGWSASVGQGSASYLVYGPYNRALSAGTHTATFRLMIDNVTADNGTVAELNVNDATGSSTLASTTVSRQSFHNSYTYQDFSLSFSSAADHAIEFRVLWSGVSYLRVRSVTVQ